MNLRKIYFATVVVLVGLFVTQVSLKLTRKPDRVLMALWKNKPGSLPAAKRLSSVVVTGKVVKIERGEDFVVPAPGEPENEIRIPVEIVTIEVVKTHKGRERRGKKGKGAKKQLIRVFHTGDSQATSIAERPEPPASERPPKPPGGIERPQIIEKPPVGEAHSLLLHDDPIYTVGESYVLFLMDGPTVKVQGRPTTTKAVISPEGRYQVVKNRIQPVTKRQFADKLRGTSLETFETEIGK